MKQFDERELLPGNQEMFLHPNSAFSRSGLRKTGGDADYARDVASLHSPLLSQSEYREFSTVLRAGCR
jgi:hypothetical protein